MLKIGERDGITLIAIIVTIIVLLILAGIAINMLAGNNGILNKVAEAKVKTDEAKEDEEIRLTRMAALSNVNGTTHKETLSDLNPGYQEVTVPIPAGFAISPREGEQNIETGLVIIDENGNEYVWIPVFTKEQVGDWGADYLGVSKAKTVANSEFDSNDIEAIKTALRGTSSIGYTKTYIGDSLYSDDWYGKDSTGDAYSKYYYTENGTNYYYSNGNLSREEYNELYNNMLISVYKNGGFYIGRYEMGTAVVNTPQAASTASRTKESKEYVNSTNSANERPRIGAKPVIMKNAVPYNWITQSQAEMLAESLNHTGGVDSILFGVQWDMVCVYLEHFGKVDSTATQNAGASFTSSYLTANFNSKLWGNYDNATFKLNQGFYTNTISYSSSSVTWKTTNKVKGNGSRWICTTGASEQNKALNIYDFAGNDSEWTLERYSDADCPSVLRGSSYNNSSHASARIVPDDSGSSYHRSARPSLCIK